jgi:hypothetical protein
MTPKEKAIELVDKFIDYVNCWDDETADPNYTQAYNYSKQCALITVNEILKVLNDYWNQDCKINNTKIGYYEEVKQEIEKL